MSDLIAKARALADKPVQRDDGYHYFVPARDLVEISTVLRELADALETAEETGASLIAAERATHPARGYDADHDRQHAQALTLAAEAYVAYARGGRWVTPSGNGRSPSWWPWSERYWKPRGRIRTLVKAGGLIAAAIDSLIAAGEPIPPAPEENERP